MRAIGWGQLKEEGRLARQLQQVDVPYISNKRCQELYQDIFPGSIQPSIVCAMYDDGVGGRDACAGDSGGPLFIHDQVTGQPIVYGITSWGKFKQMNIKCASLLIMEIARANSWLIFLPLNTKVKDALVVIGLVSILA